MTVGLYLPSDEFSRQENDLDLAADYLELTAFFSPDRQALSQDITDALDAAQDEDFDTVEEEIGERGEAATGTVERISYRARVLNGAYPFKVDPAGEVIRYQDGNLLPGQAAYLLSLILSHLKSVSELFNGTLLHPEDEEVRKLRNYFQYFATVAMAGEIGGQAWSFGYPRPDGSGFLDKLKEIWHRLKDGTVNPDPSAGSHPKDDKIDVFAWRDPRDGLPGFLLAAAQVATGKAWRDKPVKFHVGTVFTKRWFSPEPVTEMLVYHIIPFTIPDEAFRGDVLVLGNILHRLRLPVRVQEGTALADKGVAVEAIDRLPEVVKWLHAYRQRGAA